MQAKVKELGFDLSKTNLSEKEHLELQQLIFHFRDRFEIDPKKTEVFDLVKFGIVIRDDKTYSEHTHQPSTVQTATGNTNKNKSTYRRNVGRRSYSTLHEPMGKPRRPRPQEGW